MAIRKSLFPRVSEDIDLSGIDLSQYDRCPLCGRKLKYKVSEKKLEANRANLKKRSKKGGRPKKGESAHEKS